MKRFWNKVERHGTGCWEWTANRHRRGYGRFHACVNPDGSNRQVLSHRFSWELTNGPIPDGMCVLHRCDNPPCVNPDHLFLGTQGDNITDMVSKQRNRSKLSIDQIPTIRSYLSQGCTSLDIALLLGCHPTTISRIATGKSWSHV